MPRVRSAYIGGDGYVTEPLGTLDFTVAALTSAPTLDVFGLIALALLLIIAGVRRAIFRLANLSLAVLGIGVSHAQSIDTPPTLEVLISAKQGAPSPDSVVAYFNSGNKVSDECPACGSHRLSPERGIRTDIPDVEWERPVCVQCGWAGEPVRIEPIPAAPDTFGASPEGECMVPTVPLRKLIRPEKSDG